MEHLLFLAHRIPYPPTKGDKVRSYHLLKHLAARYKVHLGAFIDDKADLEHAAALRAMCEDCHLVPLNGALARLASLAALVSGEPCTLRFYRSASMREWVDEVMRKALVRRVVVFSSAMAQYAMSLGVRRVADLVDVDSDKWRQYAATRRWPLSVLYRRESKRLLRYEREVAQHFDATVLVSAAEAHLFRRLAHESAHKIWHVNNGVDAEFFSPERDYENPYGSGERALVFTGAMDYWPNVDAVVSFARRLFPEIHRKMAEARFCIVGARPLPIVRDLVKLPGVRVTGTVPDVRPYLAHAKLAVAPLRVARGVQNKVLEAMAMAKPVLVSPHAAEGIEAQRGTGIVVASDEAEWIREALNLLLAPDQADALGRTGREHVLRSYAWDRTLASFDELLLRREETVAEAVPSWQGVHTAGSVGSAT